MVETAAAWIAVVGAGSWGSALALNLSDAGRRVRLFARRHEQVEEIRRGHNERYLPGSSFSSSIEVSDDLAKVVSRTDVVLLAVPAAAVAETTAAVAAQSDPAALVGLAKGLERGTGRRMSEVMTGELGGASSRCAVLLGPSHAEEVAQGLPTAIVLAGGDEATRARLQRLLSTPSLRVYTNDDLVGVETAAALKNILAIAAGICDGLGLGDNTKGALLTRGIAEIARLGQRLGGRRDTYYGLSGIGDVITTCLSRHNRNRALGELIGRGRARDEALRSIDQVVEGVDTARTVVTLAAGLEVEMPISEEVEKVLFEGKSPQSAIEDLMSRSLKSEWEGFGA